MIVTHGILIEAFIKKYFSQELITVWPDVIRLKIKNAKYIDFQRVDSLVPSNYTDHSQLDFYPLIQINK
jgi:hypothetical protein